MPNMPSMAKMSALYGRRPVKWINRYSARMKRNIMYCELVTASVVAFKGRRPPWL